MKKPTLLASDAFLVIINRESMSEFVRKQINPLHTVSYKILFHQTNLHTSMYTLPYTLWLFNYGPGILFYKMQSVLDCLHVTVPLHNPCN